MPAIDRSGAVGQVAADTVPHVRTDAASAKAENPMSGLSASYQLMCGAAKGSSWKDQPFVSGAATGGSEPLVTVAALRLNGRFSKPQARVGNPIQIPQPNSFVA